MEVSYQYSEWLTNHTISHSGCFLTKINDNNKLSIDFSDFIYTLPPVFKFKSVIK